MRKRRLQAKARVICRDFLDGKSRAVETCMALFPYSFQLTNDFLITERNFLKAVSSEADDLPVGRLAELWHPDYIEPKLEKLKRYDEEIHADVRDLCEQFLHRQAEIRTDEATEQ